MASLKKKKSPKSGSKKKAEDDRSLVLKDQEPVSTQESENKKVEAVDGVETFPSRIVAMHRVRWNMNKGSERWLCSGGAAGVVRCQEIILSDTNKRRAAKK